MKIYTAPQNSGEVILGRTLPALLDEGCDVHPNSNALNQWTKNGWQSLSNQEFRTGSKELAQGLLELGLEDGDRVCLFMYSDVHFCIADMGCLMANLIDVPIHLTEASEKIFFIIQHTEAQALIVSNLELLAKIAPELQKSDIKIVILAEVTSGWQETVPNILQDKQVLTIEEVRGKGKAEFSADRGKKRPREIHPHDIATIIYTSGTTGQPKGVMLTHENISADILAVFTGIGDLEKGNRDVALSFMPMTHITARGFFYGHLNYGHRVYFTKSDRLLEHLTEVQPTILMAVPRLLEKFYEQIQQEGSQLTGFKKFMFDWALNLAKRYELGKSPKGLYGLQFKIAEILVFSKWRSMLGGRIKYLLSGGAALRSEMANFFSAAKMTVLEGYGLTESSSTLCCNRREFKRAGTVGVPIPGVKMMIAADGEVLAHGPGVTKGYYKNSEATQAAIDEQGWFHTGDIGEFTPDGFLKITDRKKNLFKLSTGKYVTPQPLESKLQASPLVEQAIVVGEGKKFCAMLIFPNLESLYMQADKMGLSQKSEEFLKHPKILELYQILIDRANEGLPDWSTVKHFQLIDASLTWENEMLTPSFKVRRKKISEVFAAQINAIYS